MGSDPPRDAAPDPPSPRPSQSEIAAARKAERQAEMERDIASGRLVVRQMTPEELEESKARRAAAQARGESRPKRRRS
jgi:hypothetical protein